MLNRKRIEPGPGQESVWDYPRPPVLVPDRRLVEGDDALAEGDAQARQRAFRGIGNFIDAGHGLERRIQQILGGDRSGAQP